MENMKTNDFSKSIKVSVSINDLIDLGWELSEYISSKEIYHVDILVDEYGKSMWRLTNTQKLKFGYWEGSSYEATGSDEVIKDLQKLNNESKLFNIQTY